MFSPWLCKSSGLFSAPLFPIHVARIIVLNTQWLMGMDSLVPMRLSGAVVVEADKHIWQILHTLTQAKIMFCDNAFDSCPPTYLIVWRLIMKKGIFSLPPSEVLVTLAIIYTLGLKTFKEGFIHSLAYQTLPV